MDELFAALDEITRNDAQPGPAGAVREEQWLTVIFVTHSVYESVYPVEPCNRGDERHGRDGFSADIPIDVAYPRSEEYRMSTAYNDYCRKVSATLTADRVDHAKAGVVLEFSRP